jgi:aminomuconate-semialdehyde/2-hydroxymuconate-6-semialdehyde dehydrogenase
VACISPWNLPLYLLTWKIAPALAAGNCVVAKPSEVTPMTAHLLGALCAEAGFPPGVLNIVQGLGPRAGGPLCAHRDVRAISFTGSTRVGGEIARESAASFKKLSLEMGGKNPTLIFADADLREAVPQALRAAFSNTGQICLCGSRILIEKPIYAQVRDALVERVRALRVGDPLEPATEQGALVSRQHFDKVMGCLAVARGEGARVLCGGERASVKGRCAGGFFVQPTLLEGLGPGCRTNQEEIFGPVATLLPFEGAEEAVQLANSTRYGLAASLWTRDLSRAHKVAARLHSGIVWVNCWMLRDLRTPFGGVKESGVGREGGMDALRFFTEPKNVCVKL